jgi:hypothetical protein
MVFYFRTTREAYGTSIGFFRHISQYFNATPDVKVRGYQFGTKDPLGKWNGIVGAVVDGKAHITSWITLTFDRNSDLIQSMPIFADGLGFVVRLAKEEGIKNPISFLMRAFKPSIWGMEVLSIVAISGLVLIIQKKKNWNNFGKTVFELMKPAIDQTFAPSFVRKNSSINKLLLGPWLLIGIVLGCELKTQLISRLTQPQFSQPPKTFSDLIKSQFKIAIVGINDTAGTVLKTSKHLQSKISHHYNASQWVGLSLIK